MLELGRMVERYGEKIEIGNGENLMSFNGGDKTRNVDGVK